jgi:hypothetical protein
MDQNKASKLFTKIPNTKFILNGTSNFEDNVCRCSMTFPLFVQLNKCGSRTAQNLGNWDAQLPEADFLI